MSKRYPFEYRIKRPFAYTPAIDTDVGKTIKKEKLKLQPPVVKPPEPPPAPKVPALEVMFFRQAKK